MNKKYGPLPLWAWGLSGIVAIYLYYRYSQSSSSTSSSSAAVNDGIDPVTGIPYIDEENAYQTEAASSLAPGSGGGSTGDGTGTPPDYLQGEIDNLTTSLQQLASSIPTPTGASTMPFIIPSGSDFPTLPVLGGNPPSSTPIANTRRSTGHLVNPKAIQAPHGAHRPPPKRGYTTVGTGEGNYQYVPDSIASKGGQILGTIRKTKPKAPKGKQVRGLGGGLYETIPAPPRTPPRHRTTDRRRRHR